jgi:hypothetical protein
VQSSINDACVVLDRSAMFADDFATDEHEKFGRALRHRHPNVEISLHSQNPPWVNNEF